MSKFTYWGITMRIISFDKEGWRARIDDNFTMENVARVADGAGAFWADRYPGAVVFVGYDTRIDADQYAMCAAEVLATYGLNVKLSNQACPLPALGFNIANDTRACGGLMVTASGSPAEYQGIYLRNNLGGVISSDDLYEIEQLIPQKAPLARGSVDICDFMTVYKADLLSYINKKVIEEANLKVVVDPMFGTGSDFLAGLLADLGVDVVEIHGDDDFEFAGIHPRPVEPWIDECERCTVNLSADAGFVLDGDGDRAGTIDGGGHFINPHRQTALIIEHLLLNKSYTGRIVMPWAGSCYISRQARYLDCPLTTVPTGFEWASREMIKNSVLLASDSRGGVAIPSHLIERDGILVILLLVEMMATTGMNMTQLVESLDEKLGRMYYGRRDVELEVAELQVLKNLLPGFAPEKVAGKLPIAISHADGLRMQFGDESWILVRPSTQTSKVRIYAEAPTPSLRDTLISECVCMVRALC